MNDSLSSQVVFTYQSLYIDKSQPLGRGSYGAVYKAKCDQLPCAAKVLHPTIIDPRDSGTGRIMTMFKQECAFLEGIRHPNIVQYLAMTMDPESRLPVLLMELLDESLTNMLECSQHSLAYYVQVDICHDIALAVAYLHSNDIIHRDLSSNNVLIIAGRRAKVTDFGMSKLAKSGGTALLNTLCPGTLAYMPPEAQREPPSYTKKLDCFSEGVIMIQVCTRLWPVPGPRTQLVPDSRSPTGSTEMPVLETERRRSHINLIDHTHALLPIAMDCLKYQERERPSSEELCQRLAGLKEFGKYRERLRKVEEHNPKIDKQQFEIQEKEKQLMLQANNILELEKKVKELEGKLATQERYIYRLNKQLEDEQEHVDADDEKNIYSNQTQVELFKKPPIPQRGKMPSQQKHQLPSQQKQQHPHPYNSESSQLPPPLPPKPTTDGRQDKDTMSAKQSPSSHSLSSVKSSKQQQNTRSRSRNYTYLNLQVLTSKKVALNWRDGGRTPINLVRGDAVVSESEAYFVSYSGEVCSYNSTIKRWRTHIKCRYRGSSLAVVNGSLTTIGGFDGGIVRNPKNNLLSLSGSTSIKGWIEILPPMPTKRCNTASITTKGELIVAGGESGTSYMERRNTVEVLDIQTLAWSTVASLPHSFSSTSATICGDDLYLLGGLDDDGETKSVLTCSLTELLHSHGEALSVWYEAADTAFYYSTCATVNGELLAVGGCDKDNKPTAAVHKYRTGTNSWELISSMPTARHQCLVAVFASKEMLVVGGNKNYTPIDIIEMANF